MNLSESVTDWLYQMREGDRLAVQKLWERYFQRLVRLARRQLRSTPRRASDEEDVALEAFASFCSAVDNGRYPDLNDRHGLWQVLISLTINKSVDLVNYNDRAKRTWRRTEYQSEIFKSDSDSGIDTFSEMLKNGEPEPAFAIEMSDYVDWLLRQLADEQLRQIAQMKLGGWKNLEIAQHLQCAESTVERRLRLIRRRLEEQFASDKSEN